jgi:hypothetical protein
MPHWPKTKSLIITAVVMVGLLAAVVLVVRPSTRIAIKETLLASGNLPRANTPVLSSEPIRIPKSNAEVYAAQQGQSAVSLVALSRATGDPAWLQRAVELHPEDPRVQLERWHVAKTPEEKALAVAALRAAAPNNPLGHYLASQQAFKSKDLGAVANLLVDASFVNDFSNYTTEVLGETESAFRASGLNEADALMAAFSVSVNFSAETTASLGQLGNDIGDLQHVFVEMGYWDEADFLLEQSLTLGEQLQGSGLIIDNLVGIALQRKLLSSFDPETIIDWNGTRASERLQQLDADLGNIKTITESAVGAIGSLDADGLAKYRTILLSDGELAAMRWLKERK